MNRLVVMGGHMHGDFNMSEMLVPSYGALTPHGIEVGFAPYETKAAVSGYHSVEKDIVTAICAYVIDSEELLQDEKRRLFEVLLSEKMPDEEPELGASRYADFGDDDHNDMMTAIELDGMRLNHAWGRAYLQTIVFPGREEYFLSVSKNEQGELELKNNYRDTSMRFAATEIPKLLEVFLGIGKIESRTSKGAVLHSIAYAQKNFSVARNQDTLYIVTT